MNRYSYEILKWLKSEIYELSSYINGLTCKMRYDYTLPERMQLNEIAKKIFDLGFEVSQMLSKNAPADETGKSETEIKTQAEKP